MTQTILRPLTASQRRVWEFIRDHHARTRTGCGFRRIADALGFASPNASYGLCTTLRDKGWMTFEPNQANTVIPTTDSLEVPDGSTT